MVDVPSNLQKAMGTMGKEAMLTNAGTAIHAKDVDFILLVLQMNGTRCKELVC